MKIITFLCTAVFDCNVHLQAAARKKSVAADCLRLVENSQVKLFLSKAVLDEITDVLNRPSIRNHFQSLTDEIVEAFLLKLQKQSQFISRVPERFSYLRDPDDEPYLDLAIEAEANFIVSRDKDLLDLMTDYAIEAKEFRQKFRSLRIIETIEFLKEVRKMENEDS